MDSKGVDIHSNVRVYKRRYWMLALFSFLSLLSGMLAPQYVSLADVMGCYYGVSQDAINWTILIIMAVYIVFVFPFSYLINHVGLRWTIISASVCTTTASLLQFLSLKPDGFPFVMLSSFFVACSNFLVLAVPPFLAAKWFPSEQLSRACAVGVFGNQLGIAVGIIFSTSIVPSNCELTKEIEEGKRKVAISLSAVNSTVFLIILLTFQNSPKVPPNLNQSEKEVSLSSYIRIVISMLRNKYFILLLIVYGLVVGVGFAFFTTLNFRMLHYFPRSGVAVEWMGTVFVLTGLLGSIIAGFILDYTRKFKQTSLGICIFSFLTCVAFSFLVSIDSLLLQFFTIGMFGFFLASFLPVGLEYGIEVTHPEPEVITASFLNASTNLIGIIITVMASHLLEDIGPSASSASLCITLFLSCVLTGFLTTDYKRSKVTE